MSMLVLLLVADGSVCRYVGMSELPHVGGGKVLRQRADTPTHRHTDTPTHRHTDTPKLTPPIKNKAN